MNSSSAITATRRYKYLGLLTALYITFQLISDVTAGKIISFFGFPVSVTVVYFPVTYIITEVYGYAKARSVLWVVLLCSILAGVFYQLVVILPPASFFTQNESYVQIFGQVPRILIGGWIAVFAGEISNSYVLAKLKILCNGRWLWVRTISSTIVGQFVNTFAFYAIALSGVLPLNVLLEAVITGWLIKTAVEVIFTPVTYIVVGYLKRVENEDYYDRDTDFNPIIIERVE
jgi:uncharacterized integral membrane protein (TIGR00697 family)